VWNNHDTGIKYVFLNNSGGGRKREDKWDFQHEDKIKAIHARTAEEELIKGRTEKALSLYRSLKSQVE